MKPNKKFYFFTFIFIAVALFVVLFLYFNQEDSNSFTNSDRKWLAENENIRFDIETINDYPVYGDNGVFDSFIKDLGEATSLDFNVINRSRTSKVGDSVISFTTVKGDKNITNKDILLNEDVYISLGKTKEKYNEIRDFENIAFGVFSEDVGDISYYLKEGRNLTFKTYTDINKLFGALDNGDVNMIIIPNIMYLDHTIGKEEYHINYIFTEMSNKIVLSFNDSNSKLNEIVKKYFIKWKEENFIEEYNKVLLNYYVENNGINSKTTKDILSKTYTYGYVKNYPYEVKGKESLEGITAEYINRFQRLTGIEFEFNEYKSINELKKAVDKKEVDVFFNYYDFDNTEYLNTVSTYIEKYVILGKTKDYYVINSFEALKGKDVNILNNNALYSYFKDNSKANVIKCESIKDLVRKNNNLLVVDYEVYSYYKNSKFSDYEVLFTDIMTNDYYFMVINNDADFYNLFNYIINTNSYYNYRNKGLNSLNSSILEKTTFEELYIILLSLIILPIVILSIIYVILKKKKKIKLVRKDERKKYTDLLTSLKNRNYLNLNIKAWDASKKYPQTIIVIDLNSINYVNDNYGYEAGDKLILKAASMLVSTQLEKSEIIRTDGNEFLIYLVGYSEQQIATYTKKLSKEMKKLPYEFGAAIGYSMITDDIKTIGDAINEATQEMKNDKEGYK